MVKSSAYSKSGIYYGRKSRWTSLSNAGSVTAQNPTVTSLTIKAGLKVKISFDNGLDFKLAKFSCLTRSVNSVLGFLIFFYTWI